MTRYKPTLTLKRLRIERLGLKAYDERFHSGVNILRGDNSSGKSTILNFLYYALGGDVSDWSPVALLCTRVLAEVSLNGHVATLARDVSGKTGQPMEIFGGEMKDALEAPASSWDRHPYRRSETRESFSQVLFRLLDIPEASNEASGNVTVHQMLRLMYADQLSPVGTLFKFEQFDPPLLRDTVGRLVFGAYENELYANQLRLRALDDEFTNVSSELGAIYKLVGQSGEVLTPSWIAAEYQRLKTEQAALEAEIGEAEKALFHAGQSEKMSLSAQNEAYAEVQRLQESIKRMAEKIDTCKFEIADAQKFIADLESKLSALQDSSATSDAFQRITFQHCPACYSTLETDAPVHACHLCKNPFDSKRAQFRIVSLINDTSKQLRQSRNLQRERAAELAQAEIELRELNSQWQRASRNLARTVRTPSSDASERLRNLQRRAGYIDHQFEDLARKERLSTALEKLIARKAHLNAEITTLKARNESLAASLSRRLNVAYSEVEEEILYLLHHDLPREEAFIHAQSVQFDFSSNKLSVDNQSYFSASSRVILRNSFFLGLLGAATKDTSFRHFRFCAFDSIEDKGMQPDRSHNFQRLIVAVSQAARCEHQIIYATSMIAPELDVPNLTVGHYSTLDKHTLDIQTSGSA